MLLVIMLLFGPVVAHAQAVGCEPLDLVAFLTQIDAAQDAAQRQMEASAFEAVVGDFRARLECLVFVPSPKQWADYLVLESLFEFGRGGPWEAPLNAALTLRPQVSRGVGGAHPIARYVARPEVAAPGEDVPEAVVLYVDGQRAAHLPGDDGVHLVQREDGGRWRSLVARPAAPVTLEQMLAPIRVEQRWTWQGNASVVLAPGGGIQRRADSWPFEVQEGTSVGETQHYVPDVDWVTAWPSISARGAASYGRFGLIGEADVALIGLTRPTGTHVQGFLAYAAPTGEYVGLGLGVGGSTLEVGDPLIDDTVRQTQPIPYAAATVQRWRPKSDAGLTGGVGAGAWHASTFAGLHPAPGRQVVLRVGLCAVAQFAWFEQPTEVALAGGPLRVSALNWRAGLEVGMQRRPGARPRATAPRTAR